MTNEQFDEMLKEMSIRQAAGMRAMSDKEIERMQIRAAYLAQQQGPMADGHQAQMLNSFNYWMLMPTMNASPQENPSPTRWERFKRWLLN